MDKVAACIDSYRRLKNLKMVGAELGIPWQTVYVHLRKAGEPVTGDKTRYGSDKDRLAAKAEAEFKRLVPWALDQNRRSFQAKVDFIVGGFGVDVKSSTKRNDRWSFSLKKQELLADFFVCFAYGDDEAYSMILVPGDVCRKYQSMSLSANTRTKWWDYEIESEDVARFFRELSEQRAA